MGLRDFSRTCCRVLVLTVGCLLCFRTSSSFNLEPRLAVIKLGSTNTYFGFSVAQHIVHNERTGGSDSRILVGAPRDSSNQPETNVTGAVYECAVNALLRNCKMLHIDDTEPVLDDEFKNDQWLGVTVKSQGPGGYVLACAHRYVRKGETYRWGNGICYSLTQNLDYYDAFNPCENRPVQKAHEQFGYCQAGTSGTITEDNKIVIGTPGPYTWTGTVFINTVTQGISDDYTWYYGPLYDSAPVDKYSYLGMSVTAGRFFGNEISFVAGAPRANNTGQVVFFRRIPGNETLHVQAVLNGELFASSFGYEIGTADLNGDGAPDLIVGAPFFYGKNAGGAIYVYLNSRKRNINRETIPTRITGKPDSRFGYAIANCSDLNKDGYEDIAVGAPYEGNGVVYIYLGSEEGIQMEPVQVIKSEDLSQTRLLPTLRTFGHSLSGGLDLDENRYPDLIVGAYESDAIVLLRARPIISIITRTDSDGIIISPTVDGCVEDRRAQEACFSFRTCFQITSKEALKTSVVAINYTLEAETFHKKISRVTIRGSTDTRKSVINRTFTIRSHELLKEKCQKEVVYLTKFSRGLPTDILTPVSFKVAYSLIQKPPVQPTSAENLVKINDYPILNQQEASKIFQVHFEKDCGSDDICESDLDVRADLIPIGGVLSLGEMQNTTVRISVRNKNESAYEAAVYIVHPESLIFSHGKAENSQNHCNRADKTTVVCNLDNPFKSLPDPTVFNVEFGTNKVKDNEHALHFEVFANSTSKEKHKKSPIPLTYEVQRRAKLIYTGIASPEQVKYGGEIRGQSAMKHENDVGSEISHTHTLMNTGPWLVRKLTMTFHWPIEIKDKNLPHGKRLLYLLEPPTISQTYGTCFIKDSDVNFLNLTLKKIPVVPPPTQPPRIKDEDLDKVVGSVIEGEAEGERHQHRNESHYEERVITRTETRTSTRVKTTMTSETTSSETRSKRDTEAAEKKSNKVVFECGRTATCLTFQCNIENLHAGKNVVVRMRARLWNSTFVSEYPTVESVQIVTAVDIVVDPTLKIELLGGFNTRHTIKTNCYPDIPYSQLKKEIPYWIYIVAACVGIIILAIIIFCLWMLGFFKRKHQKEMQRGVIEKNAM